MKIEISKYLLSRTEMFTRITNNTARRGRRILICKPRSRIKRAWPSCCRIWTYHKRQLECSLTQEGAYRTHSDHLSLYAGHLVVIEAQIHVIVVLVSNVIDNRKPWKAADFVSGCFERGANFFKPKCLTKKTPLFKNSKFWQPHWWRST